MGDWRPIRPSRLFTLSHEALNVWVFVILGLTTAALPKRHYIWGALLALFTPPVIETIQYALPALGRACQSGDLVNNWSGAAIGLMAAAVWRYARSR